MEVESRVGSGYVEAPVRAAALVAVQGTVRGEPGERGGVGEQRAQPLSAAFEAGPGPHRATGPAIGPLEREGVGRRWGGARCGRGLRLVERRERRPAAEHEALRERVRGQAVGAM